MRELWGITKAQKRISTKAENDSEQYTISSTSFLAWNRLDVFTVDFSSFPGRGVEKGKQSLVEKSDFLSREQVFSYVLFSCWCNFLSREQPNIGGGRSVCVMGGGVRHFLFKVMHFLAIPVCFWAKLCPSVVSSIEPYQSIISDQRKRINNLLGWVIRTPLPIMVSQQIPVFQQLQNEWISFIIVFLVDAQIAWFHTAWRTQYRPPAVCCRPTFSDLTEVMQFCYFQNILKRKTKQMIFFWKARQRLRMTQFGRTNNQQKQTCVLGILSFYQQLLSIADWHVLGPVHTGRRAPCGRHHANNGIHCCKWECSHRLHATSKGLHANCVQICLRVLCERGLSSGTLNGIVWNNMPKMSQSSELTFFLEDEANKNILFWCMLIGIIG